MKYQRGKRTAVVEAADKRQGMTVTEALAALATVPEHARDRATLRVDVGFGGQVRAIKLTVED